MIATSQKWEVPPKRVILGLLLGWGAFLLINFLPPPAGMKPEAMKTMAVVAWAVIIWVTEAIPVGVTGLVIPMLLFVTKALPQLPDAFGGFTAHTTYICLGAFIMAAMMQLAGLDRRISILCLNVFRVQKVSQLIRAMFLSNFILALLIPSTAARGATLLPIIKGFLDVFGDSSEVEKAKAHVVIQCMIYSTIMCGVIVMTAHMPNIIMINLLEKKHGISIGYGQWLWLHLPMVALWFIVYFWTSFYFKTKKVTVPGGFERVCAMKDELGPTTRAEWLLLGLFCFTAVTWAVGKEVLNLPLGIITIMALCLFFIPGLLPWKWKMIQRHTTWGVFFFLAGAMSLSVAMTKTGLAAYLADLAKPIAMNQYWMVTLSIVMVTTHIIRVGMLSNVAAIAFLAPVVLDLASIYNMNPVSFTLMVCDIDTFAFIIPTQLTLGVLGYSLGAFNMKDYAIVGLGSMALHISFSILIMSQWYAINGFPLVQ